MKQEFALSLDILRRWAIICPLTAGKTLGVCVCAKAMQTHFAANAVVNAARQPERVFYGGMSLRGTEPI